MISLGFIPSAADECLMFKRINDLTFFMLLYYVDDVIIACTDFTLLMDMFEAIKTKFRVSSDGRLDNFLGIKIEQDELGAPFELSMCEYVEKIFARYKLSPRQSVLTPMVENFQAQLESAPLADQQYVDDFCYSEKIGSLLFLMVCMCLDIAFGVCLLARYCNKVSRVACAGVTRLLQYAYNTKNRTFEAGWKVPLYFCFH